MDCHNGCKQSTGMVICYCDSEETNTRKVMSTAKRSAYSFLSHASSAACSSFCVIRNLALQICRYSEKMSSEGSERDTSNRSTKGSKSLVIGVLIPNLDFTNGTSTPISYCITCGSSMGHVTFFFKMMDSFPMIQVSI